MIDNIKIRVEIDLEDYSRLSNSYEWKMRGDYDSAVIHFLDRSDRNLYFKLFQSKLFIKGSFHSYINGHNSSRFTRIDFCNAIDQLSLELGLDLKKATVISFEAGLNIKLEIPALKVLEKITGYKGKSNKQFDIGFQNNYLKAPLKIRPMKLYNKTSYMKDRYNIDISENILRYELIFKRLSNKPSFRTIEQLCKKESFELIGRYLKQDYKDIIFEYKLCLKKSQELTEIQIDICEGVKILGPALYFKAKKDMLPPKTYEYRLKLFKALKRDGILLEDNIKKTVFKAMLSELIRVLEG